MAIRITSDSTCDLNQLVEERNIGILALQVNLGANAYHDGVDITPEDIFAFVEQTKELPKTSAPSIGDYEDFFKEQLAFGDEVIHFNISSKSSGSHNFAKQAAESFNGKVRVIDSMALSSGQGLPEVFHAAIIPIKWYRWKPPWGMKFGSREIPVAGLPFMGYNGGNRTKSRAGLAQRGKCHVLHPKQMEAGRKKAAVLRLAQPSEPVSQ